MLKRSRKMPRIPEKKPGEFGYYRITNMLAALQHSVETLRNEVRELRVMLNGGATSDYKAPWYTTTDEDDIPY